MNTSIYPWQQAQWQLLLSQHQQQRIPHALLFSGPAGLGKSVFVQQFAYYLLCKAATTQACGQCASCRLIQAHNHPDLLYIAPEERGKNIKIDLIREMTLTLQQTAQRMGYQVAVIAPVEALNKAAANALLKTLEEPPGNVVLLLVSDQPGALPATIVSRCQHIHFAGAAENASTWLDGQLQALNIQGDTALLLGIAENSPLRALHLAQNNYLGLRDELLAHLIALSQRSALSLAPVANYLKQDLMMWVDALIALVTDMLRLHLGVVESALTNRDRLQPLRQLTAAYPLLTVLPLLDKLNQARRSLLNSQIHLNEQLLVESLLLHFIRG